MSRETPGEPAGFDQNWRRLLREPGALPGQGLADKDAAWDKLFERLSAKPRRRFFGYRVIAGCILISLVPATRLWHDRPGSDRTGSGKGAPVAERVRPVAPVIRPREVLAVRPPAPVAPVRPEGAPVAPAAHVPKKRLRPERDRVADRNLPARVTPASAAAPAPGAAAPAPTAAAPAPTAAATAPTAAATAPGAPIILTERTPVVPADPLAPAPKKQWKVVDINELEPGNTRPRMVAGRQPRQLRLGFGASNTGVPENSPARGDDSRLKITLTTQNH